MSIKNLIFDFGNIFIDLDHEAGFRELYKVGLHDFTPEMHEQNLIYEKGLYSSDQHIDFYLQKFPEADSEEFIAAWSAILGEIPEHRIDFLEKLADSGKYKLFLLSNTNDLHIQHVKNNYKIFNRFIKCFDKIYLSHEINMRKPDAKIYQHVIEENNLTPSETLFIDDLAENTKAAQKLGLRVWNLIPKEQDVTDLFSIKKELFED